MISNARRGQVYAIKCADYIFIIINTRENIAAYYPQIAKYYVIVVIKS